MSESYMAADESAKGISGMPKIRTEEVEQWARDAKTYLMGQKRNHKGLEDQPAAPGVGMHLANVRIKWEKDLEVWRERNDTCVSKLYEAVKKAKRELSWLQTSTCGRKRHFQTTRSTRTH